MDGHSAGAWRRVAVSLALTGALAASCASALGAQTPAQQAQTADLAARMKAQATLVPRQTGAFVATQQTSHLQAVTASNVLYDAIGDNSLAPDLEQMLALTSDDGRYTVGIMLGSNALIDGDFVASYVNTDGNALTGNPTFGGADLAVGILQRQ